MLSYATRDWTSRGERRVPKTTGRICGEIKSGGGFRAAKLNLDMPRVIAVTEMGGQTHTWFSLHQERRSKVLVTSSDRLIGNILEVVQYSPAEDGGELMRANLELVWG